MIVVDTNVIASCFIRVAESPRAREALERDTDWRVPPLWRSEFLSAARHAMARDRVTPAKAGAAFEAALALFAHRETVPGHRRVLRLVHADPRLSSYDAEFLALAHQLGTRVLTQDVDFAKAGRAGVVLLGDYLDAR